MVQITEEHLAQLQIQSLLVQERYYRDTAQWENLRNSYHPDASKTAINISWFEGTAEDFVIGSKKMAESGATSSHKICPVIIHLNEDINRALSESTGSINLRFKYEGHEYDCVSYARFISRLQKVNGEWKMLTLEAIYDQDSITPAYSLQTPANFDLEGHRASYRCLGWVLSRNGFQVNQDLPGTDRPETVTRLMDESYRWLKVK
ncbi:hypothetical protein N7540_011631 [Penicillium herquei]|nr:hypothetical protein N7540_011631 [Penicillium herquei]